MNKSNSILGEIIVAITKLVVWRKWNQEGKESEVTDTDNSTLRIVVALVMGSRYEEGGKAFSAAANGWHHRKHTGGRKTQETKIEGKTIFPLPTLKKNLDDFYLSFSHLAAGTEAELERCVRLFSGTQYQIWSCLRFSSRLYLFYSLSGTKNRRDFLRSSSNWRRMTGAREIERKKVVNRV